MQSEFTLKFFSTFLMPRISHHINNIDRILATRDDLKIQIQILLRLINHHNLLNGDLELLLDLSKSAVRVHKLITLSQNYVRNGC